MSPAPLPLSSSWSLQANLLMESACYRTSNTALAQRGRSKSLGKRKVIGWEHGSQATPLCLHLDYYPGGHAPGGHAPGGHTGFNQDISRSSRGG